MVVPTRCAASVSIYWIFQISLNADNSYIVRFETFYMYAFISVVANSCNHVTSEVVSFFKSPGYPGPMVGNLICQYDVLIKSGICAVKLESLTYA